MYHSATTNLSIQRSDSVLPAESGHVEEEDDKGGHERTNTAEASGKGPRL